MNAPVCVLIADAALNRLQDTARVLRGAGYLIDIAVHGEGALQAVRVRRPALVLLDCQLPGLDGLTVCRAIKADPDLAEMLVLLTSGAAVNGLALPEWLDAGADGHLAYPIDDRELLARLAPFARLARLSVSMRQQAAKEHEITLDLLRLIGRRNGLHVLLADVTRLMRHWSGCQAVGIRLRDGDDFPYFETRGFPAQFVECERRLCAVDECGEVIRDSQGIAVLECMCGNVLCGRFDPRLPFFTEGGSFWSNNTTQLLATTTETERQTRTRNRCNGEGYESVALVPLRHGAETIGLLQFNDARPGRFTAATIALLERLALSLAIGISEVRAAQVLQDNRARLTEANQLLAGILDHTHMMAVYLDPQFNFVWVNRAYAATCRHASDFFPGKNHFELYPDAENEAIFRRVVATGEPFFVAAKPFTFPDQPERGVTWWDWGLIPTTAADGKITGLVFTLAEVTEQRRMAEELEQQRVKVAHADRLHALGEMSAGLAHELNQPLNGIRTFAEGAAYGMKAGWKVTPEELRTTFEDIVAQVDRMSEIIDHIRTFARDSTRDTPAPFGMQEVVRNALKLVSAQLRVHGITVRVEVPDDLPRCNGSVSRVEQVLLNLVANARDAMDARGRMVSGIERQPAAARWEAVLGIRVSIESGGTEVRMAVTDTGGGIPPEYENRIFDPFFTTKEAGQGTGLGLSIAQGIVTEHGGRIELINRPGEGACFAVILPAVP